MIYTCGHEFIRIGETSGTVQNESNINTIEMSQSNEPNSGILIYPLQKHSFADSEIYLRCIDGAARARVVSFKVDAKGGDEVAGFVIAGESYTVTSHMEIANLVDEIFGTEG